MEIGGLGLINTIASSVKGDSQNNTPSGFSGLIGSLMGTSEPLVENIKLLQTLNPLPEEEVAQLLQFLQAEDILDIDGGMELLQKSIMADEKEHLVLVEEFLQTDISLENLLASVIVTLEQVATTNELDSKLTSLLIEFKGKPLLTEIDREDLATAQEDVAEFKNEGNLLENEEIMTLLTQLSSLPQKEFSQLLTTDMQDILKAVKLLELLGDNQATGKEQGQLKELLQQIAKKLEIMLGNKGTQGSKMEYLQKTFTAATTEVNASLTQQATLEERKPVPIKADSFNGFLQFQQQSKAEQLTLTMQQGGKPASSADLIKQFENILARSQFSNHAGTQKLLIKLHPEHLGALRIELLQRDAGMVAKIMTTTKMAKETLETHLNGLKQAFGSQNIQIDKVEVSQQMSYQERFLGKEQQEQRQNQERHEEQSSERNEGNNEESFNYSLEEALVNMEV